MLGYGFHLHTLRLKLMQIGLRPLFDGPDGAALCVWPGPGVYKEQEVVACNGSRQMLQNAEGLLYPENARFQKVGSISNHFDRCLLAAFF